MPEYGEAEQPERIESILFHGQLGELFAQHEAVISSRERTIAMLSGEARFPEQPDTEPGDELLIANHFMENKPVYTILFIGVAPEEEEAIGVMIFPDSVKYRAQGLPLMDLEDIQLLRLMVQGITIDNAAAEDVKAVQLPCLAII